MKLFKCLVVGFMLISFVWGISGTPVQGENVRLDTHAYLPAVINNPSSGGAFLQPASIWLTPQPLNGQLYLVIDSSGQPHIFWAGTAGGTEAAQVYLKDTGWSTTNYISVPSSDTQLISQPAVGIDNAIYLIFKSHLSTGNPYQVRYMKWDGSQWSAQQILLDNSTSRTISGEVRLNSQGNPYVFTRVDDLDFYGSHKYNYRDWNGSGFGPVQNFNSPFLGDSHEYSWLDANGGVRLIGDFYSNTTGKYTFHYANWKNGSFQITDQTLAASMDMTVNFVDNQNNTHHVGLGTSQGGTIYSLYQQCVKNDLTFDQSQMISGLTNVKYWAWGYDETHTPILAFSPDDGHNITLQILNGCQVSQQYNFVLPSLPTNNGWGQLLAAAWNQQLGKACFLIWDKNNNTKWWMQCVLVK